jgi:O-antigen ligase
MAAAGEMFTDHPLIGVGPGNYSEHFQEYADQPGMTMRSFDNFGHQQFPHNLYLEVAAETGIAGLLAFFAVIASTMISLYVAYRSFMNAEAARTANMVASLALSITAFLATSLFLHGTYIRYLWLLVAVSAAARQIGRQAELDHELA